MENKFWGISKVVDYIVPKCEFCGEECDTIYTDKLSRIPIGCDQCITKRDPWEDIKNEMS